MATATTNKAKGAISLKGSTELVSEFFGYGVNSILYQRGVYPPEMFTRVQEYGLTLLVTEDEELKKYLNAVFAQIKAWLSQMIIHKVVLVIKSTSTNEILERWQFDIECSKENISSSKSSKTEKEIRNNIRDVIRQITASVTFLPSIDDTCAFDILVYTNKDSDTPLSWDETDHHAIKNPQQVKLRSFSTDFHKVDTAVSYKTDDI